MNTNESAVTRVLAPLSEILRKPLYLVDAASPEASNAFAVRLQVPRIAVVSADGSPFGEHERKLIHELFDVIGMAAETQGRYEEMEQRMMLLHRENLELTVRNRTLSEVSTYDTLTGLFNRWYVIEKLDSEMNRSLRHGSPMSVLMLDIDHFKRVNDTWGHAAGDEVLKGVGKVLRESCRVYDVPGRYGGEEFCIVLPQARPENTSIVAERIRERLANTPLPCGDTSIVVTASIGIAGVESAEGMDLLSPAGLIDRADRALYRAKNRGRNRIERWDGSLSSGASNDH